MLVAKRLDHDGLRKSLKEAFSSMWTIEGKPGIYRHAGGCKKDFVPEDPALVVAETKGATAVFQLDEPVMEVVKAALGITITG